jgi:hypothetical protein
MNDFTKEEKKTFDLLKKPLVTFNLIQMAMDKEAKKHGYRDHKDFLQTTGWFNRKIE